MDKNVKIAAGIILIFAGIFSALVMSNRGNYLYIFTGLTSIVIGVIMLVSKSNSEKELGNDDDLEIT